MARQSNPTDYFEVFPTETAQTALVVRRLPTKSAWSVVTDVFALPCCLSVVSYTAENKHNGFFL